MKNLPRRNGNIVLFKCTNPAFDERAARAKELGRQAMVDTGARVDPDQNLVASQFEAARAGYVCVRVDDNIYGFCVRDTMNDGAGRISPNFKTATEVIAWVKKWYEERPELREVICYESFAPKLEAAWEQQTVKGWKVYESVGCACKMIDGVLWATPLSRDGSIYPDPEASPVEFDAADDADTFRVIRCELAFPVGTRVRLIQDVGRFPHFLAKAGMLGTVVVNDNEMLAVTMDDKLKGAEEWDNQIVWSRDDQSMGDDPAEDLEVIVDDDDPTRFVYKKEGSDKVIVIEEGGQQVGQWSGSLDPCDPANFWIDDKTGERVSAATGERSQHTCAKPLTNIEQNIADDTRSLAVGEGTDYGYAYIERQSETTYGVHDNTPEGVIDSKGNVKPAGFDYEGDYESALAFLLAIGRRPATYADMVAADARHALPKRKGETGSANLSLLFVASLIIIALVLGVLTGHSLGRGDKCGAVLSAERDRVAHCSLADARAGLCVIPCTTDSDCAEKNGQPKEGDYR